MRGQRPTVIAGCNAGGRKACKVFESGSDVAILRVGRPAIEPVPGGVAERSADGQGAVLKLLRYLRALFFLQAKLASTTVMSFGAALPRTMSVL